MSITFQFDLTAADYSAMNLAGFAWTPVVRHFLPHAACEAVAAWLLASWLLDASNTAAAIASVVVFAAGLAWHALSWRNAVVTSLSRHYEDPKAKSILGAHTLELGDHGLTSTGPLHKSFRDWRSVTQVVFTSTHALFHTAFGVVYILPLRAVTNLEELAAFVEGKSSCELHRPNSSLERTRVE